MAGSEPAGRGARAAVLRPRAWLGALFEAGTELELVICRYHRRRGEFSHGEVVGQQMLTFVEQGYLPARVGGRDYRVTAGEALWIPPGVQRRYYGTPETPLMRHYNLRFTLRRGGRQLSFLRAPLLVADAWQLGPLLQQLFDLYAHGHPLREERLRALVAALATGFVGLSARARTGGGARTLSPAQRLRVGQYVVDHIGEGLVPEDLAMQAGLSLDYFTRLFRNTYGLPPRGYLKRERARLAGILLVETRLSVAEVARQCGTDNVSLFCRQFRDEAGCTPSEYRRRRVPPVI
jgi:AraC-like DNA-binding protein